MPFFLFISGKMPGRSQSHPENIPGIMLLCVTAAVYAGIYFIIISLILGSRTPLARFLFSTDAQSITASDEHRSLIFQGKLQAGKGNT